MKKLSMLTLTALTAFTMAGAPAMTSQAAIFTYRVPVNSFNNRNCGGNSNSFGGGECQISGGISQIFGNGNSCNSFGGQNCQDGSQCNGSCGSQSCQGNSQILPVFPIFPGEDQPVFPVYPDGSQTPPEDSTAGSGYIKQVLALVNEERAKAGIAPLTANASAEKAAVVRSQEIKSNFSHTRPNGSGFSTALTEAGVKFRSSGENIAYGQNTPQEVMQGWMNSAGHRANILNQDFTSIGIGHYEDANGIDYWTQLFFN